MVRDCPCTWRAVWRNVDECIGLRVEGCPGLTKSKDFHLGAPTDLNETWNYIDSDSTNAAECMRLLTLTRRSRMSSIPRARAITVRLSTGGFAKGHRCRSPRDRTRSAFAWIRLSGVYPKPRKPRTICRVRTFDASFHDSCKPKRQCKSTFLVRHKVRPEVIERVGGVAEFLKFRRRHCPDSDGSTDGGQ